MNLKELKRNWNEFGRIDPLWAILTDPDKKGNRWQIDDFFKTGEKEVKEVFEYVESLSIVVSRRKALDFGCGVGRVSQALACYFDEVCGVDIAPSMVELAKKHKHHGDKCKYYLNDTNDLKFLNDNSFDFVYSNITLQHIEPRYARNYIKEFLRALAPHGLIIFQLPSEPILDRDCKPTRKLKQLIKSLIPEPLLELYREVKIKRLRVSSRGQPIMELHGIKREEVVTFLKKSGAKIVDILQDQSAGPHWMSFRYCITKE